MAIPPQVSVFWRVLTALDRAPVWRQTDPAKVRAAAERRSRLIRLPIAPVVVGRRHPGVDVHESVAAVGDGVELPLRIYRPRDSADAVLPVVVNFHGGGFVSGDARQSEWWCSAVAARAGAVVVSVEYRLAPEHPFPTPVEDCYAATAWVADHAGELGVDASRLAVMGDSAGGTMAAVVSVMARDRGGPSIALQVLIYPCVELVDEFPSESENANAPVLGKQDMDGANRWYLRATDGTRLDGTDPYASPLRAKHQDLPPALIQTAQHDPLRDQGTAYASALRLAGVPVRLTNYVNAVHGYISIPNVVPMARQALAEAVDELRAAFAR